MLDIVLEPKLKQGKAITLAKRGDARANLVLAHLERSHTTWIVACHWVLLSLSILAAAWLWTTVGLSGPALTKEATGPYQEGPVAGCLVNGLYCTESEL